MGGFEKSEELLAIYWRDQIIAESENDDTEWGDKITMPLVMNGLSLFL